MRRSSLLCISVTSKVCTPCGNAFSLSRGSTQTICIHLKHSFCLCQESKNPLWSKNLIFFLIWGLQCHFSSFELHMACYNCFDTVGVPNPYIQQLHNTKTPCYTRLGYVNIPLRLLSWCTAINLSQQQGNAQIPAFRCISVCDKKELYASQSGVKVFHRRSADCCQS